MDANGEEEYEKALSHKFHSIVLSGKLPQAVCWATDREGGVGGVPPSGLHLHQYRATVSGSHLGEGPRYTSPPCENTICAAFEEYNDVPEVVPIDFMKNEVTWAALNLSGA